MILFPHPRSLTLSDGEYIFPWTKEDDDLVALYARIREGHPHVSVLFDASLAPEEYRLLVDRDGVSLRSSTDEGLFRAVTSLHQLLRRTGGTLPFMRIEDAPVLPRRGYMLDISRGRMPRVETIKGMIDFLAALK